MFARSDFRLRLFFSIRLIAELTKPGICALAPAPGNTARVETKTATDKLNGMNFLIITFLTKTKSPYGLWLRRRTL